MAIQRKPAVKNIYGATAVGCRRVLPTDSSTEEHHAVSVLNFDMLGGLDRAPMLQHNEYGSTSSTVNIQGFGTPRSCICEMYSLMTWSNSISNAFWSMWRVKLASLIHTHIHWACCSDSTGCKETLQLEQIVRLPGESANANSLSI